MGKHFWWGMVLLLFLLGLALTTSFGIYAMHIPGREQLEQAAQAALTEDLSGAMALAQQAKQRWDCFWTLSAAMADHSPMDEIDKTFAELEVFAIAEDSQEFAACCARLSVLIESMYEAHALAWWHFL